MEKTARYYGRLVRVTCRRRIAGGVACDVVKHQAETDWPWTVTSFTVAERNLEYTASELQARDMDTEEYENYLADKSYPYSH